MAPAVATYAPRDPSHTVLSSVIAKHRETLRASLAADPDAKGLPAYVQREFYDYLQCGILAHGFLLIRKLCRLGYLEAGIDAAATRGSDPLLDNEPELARTMAASVTQRIAFGERAGQKVRRIGSGFDYEDEHPELTGPRCASVCFGEAEDVNGFSLHANTQVPAHRRDQLERLIRSTARGAVVLERLAEDANGGLIYSFTKPWSDGTTGIKLSPLELLEKLAAIVPLPRVHLVRYASYLAPRSQLRGAIMPTPRQQGVDRDETNPGTPRRNWARLLRRVFDLDRATRPFCRRGSLRIMAAITHEAMIMRLLRQLHLASVPPPIAPARSRQATCA